MQNCGLMERNLFFDRTDEQRLLTLSRQMIDMFSAGNPYDPWLARHIAVDFKCTHDLSDAPMPLLEYFELIAHIVQIRPNRQFEVVNERVDFDQSAQKMATVWQAVNVVIFPERLVRHALKIYKWRLAPSGTWVCYELTSFRNNPLMSGNIAPCFQRV